MKFDCSFVINAINQLIVQIYQNTLFLKLINTKKVLVLLLLKNMYLLNQTLVRQIMNFFNCARDCFNNYFHLLEFKCKYEIEKTNGDVVNGTVSDETLKKNVRENGFIHKLTMKIYSHKRYIDICY